MSTQNYMMIITTGHEIVNKNDTTVHTAYSPIFQEIFTDM